MDSILFAISIGQSVLLVWLLATSDERNDNQTRLLVAIFLTLAGLFAIVLAKNNGVQGWAIRFGLVFGMMLGPLLWFHAKAATGMSSRFAWHDLLWVLPVALTLFNLVGVPIDDRWLVTAMLVVLASAVCLSLVAVSRYIARFDDTFSQTGPERMAWLRIMLVLLTATVLMGIGQNLAETNGFAQISEILTYGVALAAIGLNIYTAQNLLNVSAFDAQRLHSIAFDPANHLDSDELISAQARLEAAMEKDELFRRPDLQLRALSEWSGLAEPSITEAIRRGLGSNFFDYVNTHRIRDAQAQLAETDNSITEIMLKAGFNSKSSFYTEFRKRTGRTPSEYRKVVSIR